ncbi:MAG TPA: cell division protein FtsL [Thiothrix sp.]|nr:cell division protein FtsL [Thiothrix sp.]
MESKAKMVEFFAIVVLFLMIVWAAIEVVANRQEARSLYAHLRDVEQERDRLKIQWQRLRTEQSALLNHGHIERQARDSLNMKMPDRQDVKVIKE